MTLLKFSSMNQISLKVSEVSITSPVMQTRVLGTFSRSSQFCDVSKSFIGGDAGLYSKMLKDGEYMSWLFVG